MNREEQTYSTNTGEFIAEKLLPCPFCGGEPEFITIGNDYTKSRKAEIKCTNCFVKRTTGAIRNDLEWCGRKAIELWNKRTNGLSLPPAEGAEEITTRLNELLGNPDNSIHINSYQIKPILVGGKAEWWIVHHGVGSGEPLIQWLQNFSAIQQQQPTAEGAEEILEKHCHLQYNQNTGEREVCSSVSAVEIAMQEFAALHAQRLAEKIVSERCKKCKYRGLPDSIQEALNSGDGVYRP